MVAARARRRGIGRALLGQAVSWAQEVGMRKLELHVFPHNEAAIALYEQFGFRREGYRKAHYRRGRDFVDAILMAYDVHQGPGPCRSQKSPRASKPAVRDIVPYEPGKPVEEVQRELGLERVVKLASNEGPFGPLPEALDALAEAAPELNRYPDGGGFRLRAALAERHGVRFEEIALGAGPTASSTASPRSRSTRATRSSAAGRASRAT